jgi:hypothetical protein
MAPLKLSHCFLGSGVIISVGLARIKPLLLQAFLESANLGSFVSRPKCISIEGPKWGLGGKLPVPDQSLTKGSIMGRNGFQGVEELFDGQFSQKGFSLLVCAERIQIMDQPREVLGETHIDDAGLTENFHISLLQFLALHHVRKRARRGVYSRQCRRSQLV